jgi:hypothetical protein
MQTQSNYKLIKEKIHQSVAKAAVSPPLLIAVSKGQSVGKVQELFPELCLDFGENYLQELEEKSLQFEDKRIRWHFIGQLQSRKIKKIVELAHSIHSVDQLKHAKMIDKAALELGKKAFPIFISVNASLEQGKSGVPIEAVDSFAADIAESCQNLSLQGIMTVPPREYNDNMYSSPPELYRSLRSIADKVGAGRLSLGMSSDLDIAIQSGTDIVRVGTGIFGKRSYK